MSTTLVFRRWTTLYYVLASFAVEQLSGFLSSYLEGHLAVTLTDERCLEVVLVTEAKDTPGTSRLRKAWNQTRLHRPEFRSLGHS